MKAFQHLSAAISRVISAGSIIAALSAANLTAQQVLPQTSRINATGTTAVFAASVNGSAPLSYQWLFNGTNLTDNAQITGSQSNVITIVSVTMGNAGMYQLMVSNAYGSISGFAELTVLPNLTEGMAWNPASISYGTPLGPNQLNVTSSVPGNFAYNPASGSILNAGVNVLSVVFTPNDIIDYSTVTDTVGLVVSTVPLTVIASNATRSYGAANPVFTGAITGLQNGDNIMATYSCSATTSSPMGTYPIVPALVDPNHRLTNYSVSLINGTLAVGTVVTWTNSSVIFYGTPLSSNQLNATANVPGSFAYTPAIGTVLKTGIYPLSVIFTPNDTVDYNTVTDSVYLVVWPAPLTVTAANVTCQAGTTLPAFTGAITGLINGDNITATYSCSATTNSAAGTYPIVPSLVDPNNLETNYAVSLVNGTLTLTQKATPYTFVTLAGQPGVPGTNNGSGSAAQFQSPSDVAVDSNGNIYVADQWNDTIQKVTPAGVVTTLAGQPGIAGTNDGTGSAALFHWPNGVAMDSAGNVYVADQWNDTIRKMTPVGTNWVVTTLAGQPGFSGTNDGMGSVAQFCLPGGVAVDISGNLYVTDTYNNAIREVAPVGTNWVVTTLAGQPDEIGTNDGTGSAAQFTFPNGVAVDTNGNVYVADTYNDTIRRVTPVGTNWVVTTLAGQPGLSGTNDGTGTTAQFHWPNGVAVDTNGNVYVGDTDNDTIRKVTPGGVVTTLAGQPGVTGTNNGTGRAAQFNAPSGVTVDIHGSVYVADTDNDTIRKGYLTTLIAPPIIQITQQSGSSFLFTWTAVSNQMYEVQTTTNLTQSNWTASGSAIIATNSTMTVSEPISANAQQFYRVVFLP